MDKQDQGSGLAPYCNHRRQAHLLKAEPLQPSATKGSRPFVENEVKFYSCPDFPVTLSHVGFGRHNSVPGNAGQLTLSMAVLMRAGVIDDPLWRLAQPYSANEASGTATAKIWNAGRQWGVMQATMRPYCVLSGWAAG